MQDSQTRPESKPADTQRVPESQLHRKWYQLLDLNLGTADAMMEFAYRVPDPDVRELAIDHAFAKAADLVEAAVWCARIAQIVQGRGQLALNAVQAVQA